MYERKNQDKVNNADAALPFQIILLLSRNGQSGQVSQFGWSAQDIRGDQGGYGGELCKSLNEQDPVSTMQKTRFTNYSSFLVWPGLENGCDQ